MQIDCLREQDVLDAIAARRWPNRCDEELRGHVISCPVCHDVAIVAAALGSDRDVAWDERPVPNSSIVWWRAQIRAREEAEREASRPIAVAQAVAALILMAALVVLVPFAWPWVVTVASRAADVAAWLTPRAAAVSDVFELVTGTAVPILPFAVASVLLAPIVLYYALTEE